MANQTTLFYEKCRLCLDTRGSHNVVDDHNDLQRDIFIHAGIKVKSKDNLPQKVCTICLDIINKAKDLRRVALKNDCYLRILFEDELGNDSEQQPQQLQVQTIQIHPQHQPIQIHAVGMQQVQQQQLHVATSSCQTMLPNILQLQPGTVAVSGLGQQDLSGVAHRIILQQPPHPAVYTIHH